MTKRKTNSSKTDFQPRPLIPKTINQDRYINSIHHDPVTFAIGSAGTGKTYIPAVIAADMYIKGHINHIVITRPTEECGPKMGFLPGTMQEKFEPWMIPITQAMRSRMSAGAWDCAQRNIDYVPLQYMRGRTFNDTFIICDEAQNATKEQMMMLTTRIGENAKLVISGDTKQSDISNSGLVWLISLLRQYRTRHEIIEFTLNDCVRSTVCKEFLELYERSNQYD